MTRASFKHELAAMAKECGQITRASVMARYPDKTEIQVESTLTNASSDGLIEIIGYQEKTRRGPGRGRAIYGPPKAAPEPPRPVTSVWDLGTNTAHA